MGFWKALGMFNMFTADKPLDFIMGAGLVMEEEQKENILANNSECADQWIEIIKELDIPQEKKNKAISLCNKLRRSHKTSDVNYIVSQINKLTGCHFE